MPHQSNAQPRFLLLVDLPLQALWATISRIQGTVRDRNLHSATIRPRAIPSVPRFRLLVRGEPRGWILPSGFQARLLQNSARLLRARFHQQRTQLTDGRIFFTDQVGQITEGPQKLLEFLIILFAQRLPLPLQQRLQFFPVHFDHLVGGLHLKPRPATHESAA